MVQILRECSTLFSVVKNYFTYAQVPTGETRSRLLERHTTAVGSKIFG